MEAADTQEGLQPKKIARYRVVAVSFYSEEAELLESIAQRLQKSGQSKANRSLVLREALHLLVETLQAKNDREVGEWFARRMRDRARHSVGSD